MNLKVILNKCMKFKCFVYAGAGFEERDGRTVIAVSIRPRKNSRAACSKCGKKCPGYDSLPEREYEFIPLWGIPVFFCCARRRVKCAEHGIVAELLPWGDGKHQLTNAYRLFLANWAKKLSWLEVARSFRTSWKKVYDSVAYVVEWGRERQDLIGISAIGVDEIQWGKGHDYLTLVYQINAGCIRLLWIGKDRTEATFRSFFDFLGSARSAALEYVCSDMWKPYLKVIRERASQAVNVLDRYHIVAKLNKVVDEIRAGEHRQMKKDGHEVLTHTRWCLLKRPENLTEKQEMTLKELLRYNLKSVRAYLLKEDFQGLWEYVSPAWAGKFLDRWTTRAMRSQLEPMKRFAGTIRSHKELILNYFRAKKQHSSGRVEGLNNKVKVITRRSYGFRSFKCIEIALYHALGKLPEPKLAHEFY